MLRKVLATVAGWAVAVLAILALEMVNGRLFPPPAALDLHDPAAMKSWMLAMPVGAFLLLLFSYAVASLLGGAIATLTAGRNTLRSGFIVGGLLTVGGILNLIELPHPAWFAAVSTATYIPFAFVGSRLMLRQSQCKVLRTTNVM